MEKETAKGLCKIHRCHPEAPKGLDKKTGFFASLRIMRRKGFTLIEIVVATAIISLLVGILVPLTVQVLKVSRERVTIERMKTVYGAIMGDPALGDFGFLGDIGNFPSALSDLISKPVSLATFAFHTNNVGYGWRGPYLDLEYEPLKDGWGNDFKYSTAAGLPEGQIKSAGPDGTFDNSDDIVFPFLPSGEKVEKNAPLLITVAVDDTSVAANLQGGGTPNPGGATIKVYYASNGTEVVTPFTTSAMETSQNTFDNIGFIFTTHQGLHAVELTYVNDAQQPVTTTNLFTVALLGGVQNNVVFRHPQSGHIKP